MTLPADGDCYFSSVSFQLSQILTSGKNTDFAKRLETLGMTASLSQREIVQTLSRLLVEKWLGQRRNEYEPFVSISGFSYELQAREFLTEGHFDSEIGNAMVLAVSNILQIPLITFSTMENLPVLTSIPTTKTVFEIPLYLAFTHAGRGHYDALVLHDSLPVDERPTQPVSVSCRCGQGSGAGKSKEVCNSYSSGCKCFQAIQACEN